MYPQPSLLERESEVSESEMGLDKHLSFFVWIPVGRTLGIRVTRRRIDAFELWFWKRCKRAPGTARSNQPILKEIYPKYSLEGLMLKLKVQYFDHLMQRADLLEKDPDAGKD